VFSGSRKDTEYCYTVHRHHVTGKVSRDACDSLDALAVGRIITLVMIGTSAARSWFREWTVNRSGFNRKDVKW
jgi:hypothetical protein